MFALLWTFGCLLAMRLDIGTVRNKSGHMADLTIIQDNGVESFSLEIDLRSTLHHLHGRVGRITGFNEQKFKLLIDDRVLDHSTSTLEEAGIDKQTIILLRIVGNDSLVKRPSREALLFSPRLSSSSSPKMKKHALTPRRRVRHSKVDQFHRLGYEDQQTIRRTFVKEIIEDDRLQAILIKVHPELAQCTTGTTLMSVLTPELMLEIDEIEAFLEDFDKEEKTIEPEDNISSAIHISTLVNEGSLPILFDTMALDTTGI